MSRGLRFGDAEAGGTAGAAPRGEELAVLKRWCWCCWFCCCMNTNGDGERLVYAVPPPELPGAAPPLALSDERLFDDPPEGDSDIPPLTTTGRAIVGVTVSADASAGAVVPGTTAARGVFAVLPARLVDADAEAEVEAELEAEVVI